MDDDISSDIRGALTTLQEGNNNANLPAERGGSQERLPARESTSREPATRELRRQESLPANREQEEEDERLHPDEERQEPEDRQVARRQSTTPAPRPTADLEVAPVSWKGDLKEEWKTLSIPVRQEIKRREREMAQTLSRTDEERRYAHAIYSAIKPYEAHIRAEKSNHVQAVQHLFEMAHIMRSGTVQQRAELIADLFFRHEVPIILVDQVLTRRLQGAPGPGAADPVRDMVRQELAPVREFMETVSSGRARSADDTAKEFEKTFQQLLSDPDIGDMVDDQEIRETMADLLDVAGKRGQILNLRDAAVRAIMAHPEFGPIYQQRQLEKQAQQQQDRVSKAKRAGASLSDDGAPSATNEDDEGDGSVGADLRASIAQLTRSSR